MTVSAVDDDSEGVQDDAEDDDMMAALQDVAGGISIRYNRTTQSSVDPTDFVDTAEQESSNGSLHKRKRGINHGLTSQRIMDVSKKKLVVQAREGDMHTFGETSSPFANEIGIIMRNVVSQRLTGWSQATPHDRELAYNRLLKEMVELQQSQAELEDEAPIMDEAEICAQDLGKSAGTISGIGPAPRKSHNNVVTAPPKLMQQLKILTKRD
ncbi:Hypothetical predicted protein [Olea europaea subsp. europaea]|uniref:Uncharacterized protein n=1 Tax=Olea europaea subsp. europaea TaxID=158383 RepID=A0A8S0TJW1_OLEEU|nr:Hypothetical predicted protein [Olea europaea subsp. europaea]